MQLTSRPLLVLDLNNVKQLLPDAGDVQQFNRLSIIQEHYIGALYRSITVQREGTNNAKIYGENMYVCTVNIKNKEIA